MEMALGSGRLMVQRRCPYEIALLGEMDGAGCQ